MRHAFLNNLVAALIFAGSGAFAQTDDLTAQYNRALVLKRTGHYQEAASVFEVLIKMPISDLYGAYAGLGACYKHLGRMDDAMVAWNKSLSLKPNIMVYGTRADYYISTGEFTKAIDDCNKGLAIDPSSAALMCNRGEAELKLGQTEAALQDFGRAIEVLPTMGEAYYYRSLVFEKTGNNAKSAADKLKYQELGYHPGAVSSVTPTNGLVHQ